MKKISDFLKKYKMLLCLFLGCSILFHFVLFTHDLLTADVLLNNHYYDGYAWELSLGRFGLYIFGLIKGFYVFKNIEIFLSMLLFAISSILIIDLFKIKNKVIQVLLVILISISPILSSTYLFYYCTLPYSFSFCCGVLAIYLYYNSKKRLFKFFVPITLIIMLLSCYQAYLAIPCTLFILVTIKNLFEHKFTWKDTFLCIVVILLGLILYFILMKLVLLIFSIPMSSYRSANQLGFNTILEIPNRVLLSYIEFFNYYFRDSIVNNHNQFLHISNIILLILLILGTVWKFIKEKLSFKEILLILISLMLLPLGINIITVLLGEELQLLMSSGYLLILYYLGYILEDNKLFIILGSILFIFMIRGYLIQVNASYEVLNNTYLKTERMAVNILNDFEKSNCKQLMISGDITKIDSYSNYEDDNTYGFISTYPLFWSEYSNLSNGWERFMKYYLGSDIEFVDEATYNKILDSKRYKKIKSYPSSSVIDDVLVIKFE